MENTIVLTIPAYWLKELSIDQDELRQALMLGLAQLRQQRAAQEVSDRVAQVLLSTGRAHRLSSALVEETEPHVERQKPPVLPGPPVSEILVAQRRGEL